MRKERTARRARGDGSSRDIYAEVAARIISELEEGRFPWVQPWSSSAAGGPGLPRNALTGRQYSGVNILLLWGEAISGGYASQCWLTFKQALEAGGSVRKGEKGTTIVYADRFIPEAEKARAVESGENARAVPFLKRFTVFNVAQCEGLREGLARDPAPLPEREIIPHAEALIEATGADFRIGGAKAFYSPGGDFVAVPPQPAFRKQINYYRTAFHELSAAFICAALGIVPTVRHADYVGSWLEVLKEDNRAIFRAASQASKAADYILAFAEGEEADAIGAERRMAA